MISKTKVKSRINRKTNTELAKTISLAAKNKPWMEVAVILSGPTRKYSSVNLASIDEKTKAGDTIVVPGKVLSKGELTKKVRICSLSISQSAKEKLTKTKSELVTILEEIKKNPKAQGVKIIR